MEVYVVTHRNCDNVEVIYAGIAETDAIDALESTNKPQDNLMETWVNAKCVRWKHGVYKRKSV